MLSLPQSSIYQSSKCYFSYGTMPRPDPTQLPSKGKPWNALIAQNYIHKVDLIVPSEALAALKSRIATHEWKPSYQRVIMTLGQILEGDFFTEYIKIGNIAMLSEGRIDADNVFTLKDGLLTLYLEKETYERAGLVGKPHGVKGKRGLKPRWLVEVDLRSPSMMRGKKGFDRLVYACNNVLNTPVKWLFCNLSQDTPVPDPLEKYYPTRYHSAPSLEEGAEVRIPVLKPSPESLDPANRIDLDEHAADVYEWLSLIRLESQRIAPSDNVDPYISSYAVPEHAGEAQTGTVSKISWQGFMSPTWARQLMADVILSLGPDLWFSMSATSFSRGIMGESTDCTILRPPQSPGEYLLWDVKGSQD